MRPEGGASVTLASLAPSHESGPSVVQERPLDLSVPRPVLQTGASFPAVGHPVLYEIRIIITVVAQSVRVTVDSDSDSSSDEE